MLMRNRTRQSIYFCKLSAVKTWFILILNKKQILLHSYWLFFTGLFTVERTRVSPRTRSESLLKPRDWTAASNCRLPGKTSMLKLVTMYENCYFSISTTAPVLNLILWRWITIKVVPLTAFNLKSPLCVLRKWKGWYPVKFYAQKRTSQHKCSTLIIGI